MKRFFRFLSICLTVMLCIMFTFIIIFYTGTSDYYLVNSSNFSLNLPSTLNVRINNGFNRNTVFSVSEKKNIYSADIMLFDLIPIKSANIKTIDKVQVIPCAAPFGIKLYTQGVLVVAMADVKCDQTYINPAKDAGLKAGDVITHINGREINTNEEIAAIIQESNGNFLNLKVKRGNDEFETELHPVKSYTENTYKAGLWVRDSSAGIGTLTYYDPQNKIFAGLGHGICDIDTGELLPLLSGDIVRANINDISKGESGSPGELRGSFVSNDSIGILKANTQAGVYGSMENFYCDGQLVYVALKQEIKKGRAQILSTINGSTPQLYEIEIEGINYNSENLTKNMVIRITSEELLEKTGGIVQGMSGSPIIQNDMLVGAVTHVFVNDPSRGYGIFAETMLETAESIKSNISE